jgi:copper(I)-binding protein
MKRLVAAPLMSALALFALGACQPPGPDFEVRNAGWRPPLGGGEIGVAYGSIVSRKADTVVGLASDEAEVIELHSTETVDGMSRMVKLETLDLPAGEPVTLEPGGMHLMVIRPDTAKIAQSSGDGALTITFRLQSGANVDVLFPVGGSVPGSGR